MSPSVVSVVLQAAFVVSTSGQDTIYLSRGGSTRGKVIDYTGLELRFQVAGGVERSIPASQVLRIDTKTTSEHGQADEAYSRGEFQSALALYREARKVEPRVWVLRGIQAQIVWCCRALGQAERACGEFLVLVQSDPQTPYFDCIPLAWIAAPPPVLLEQSALKWTEDAQPPAAVLLGASYLLSTSQRPSALARLKDLTTNPDQRIAFLALAQTWRSEIVTADEAKLVRWRNAIEKMPEPLRTGPYYVLALGWRQKANWQRAATTVLRIPLLYPKHHLLSSQALWEAGQILEKLEHVEQAARLYREVVSKYPQTPAHSQAQSRLNQLALNHGTTGR
jgi:tetratricopeptide (TPR) repeat protein